MSPAIQAITGALTQAQAQTAGGSSAAYTWSYTSPSGGTAVLTLQGVLYATPGAGTYGTLKFTSYADASSGNTMDGTLQVQVFQPTLTSPTLLSAVQWGSGFSGMIDVTGTLTFSGTVSGSVGVDVLDTQSGTTMTLTGTVSLAGSYFSAATGAPAATPVPTVTFSPTTAANSWSPSAGTPLTLTSTGSTAIYYTLNGALPTTSSAAYTAAITGGGYSDFVVIAFATNGSSNSRTSLRVYPGNGGA